MEKLMENEAMWHLCEHIFRYLDYKTVVKCRMVSKLWYELLKRLSIVKYINEFGYKVADFHRSVMHDTEENILIIISGWNKAVQKYDWQATIEDLQEIKVALGKLLPRGNRSGDIHPHPVKNAIRIGSVKLLEFLFCHAYDVDERGFNGERAFIWACCEGSPKIARWILDLSKEDKIDQLNYRDKDGMTAFHWASYNFEIVKWILEIAEENDAINLDARDERGMTPFHAICEDGDMKTLNLILEFSQRSDAIDLNARTVIDGEFNYAGKTAFHFACTNTRGGTAKLILDFSKETNAIDLNARDNGGMAPFHEACKYTGSPKIAKWILDYSLENDTIDLNVRDDRGQTALHWALRGVTMDTLKLLLDFSREHDSIDLNVRDNLGSTPFHTACSLLKTEAVKLMLDFSQENDKIDLNASDDGGQTALHWACRFDGNTEITKLILNFSKEKGRIDLNAKDDNLETAFQVACTFGSKETAKFILQNWKEFGIDIKNQNSVGHNALDRLRGQNMDSMDGRHELIPMLEEEYSKIDDASSEPTFKMPK